MVVCLFLLLLLNDIRVTAVCPAARKQDVKYFDVTLPEVKVPSKRTHYICQQFKVPEEQTFHAVAFEPLIGNKALVHHMLLFGCDEDIGTMDPHECGGRDSTCRSWLSQYSIGAGGHICTHEGTGVRFGYDSFKYFLLQIHWNNEQILSNVTDRSGMRVYYTPRLQENDIGNVQIGQNDIEIPSRSATTTISGGCGPSCTREFGHPLYITRTHIHMHYLGVSGKVEIYRNGYLVNVVAKDTDYNFLSSPVHVHSAPITVLPGDEIRLTCRFSSLYGQRLRNETTYFGHGSNGEMCYAFITYYPRIEGFDQCLQFSSYEMNCDGQGGTIVIECPLDKDKFVEVQKSDVAKVMISCEKNEKFNQRDCNTVVDQFVSSWKLDCRPNNVLGMYMKFVVKTATEQLKIKGFYEALMSRIEGQNMSTRQIYI